MNTTYPRLLALPTLLIATSACAQTTWTGAVNFSINNSANWTNGLPNNTGANNGIIDNGDTVEMAARDDLDSKIFIVSNGSTIHAASGINGFRWNSGTITLNGGNLDVDTVGESPIGRDAGSVTTLNINAGSTVNFSDAVSVGRLSQGIVNQTGGSFVTTGNLVIQSNAASVVSGNVFNLSGGTVRAAGLLVYDRNADNSNYFNFTSGSIGYLTITQSAFNFASMISSGDIRLDGNAGSQLADFNIDTSVGGQTTLSLAAIPEPGAYAFFMGFGALLTISVRRRRRI